MFFLRPQFFPYPPPPYPPKFVFNFFSLSLFQIRKKNPYTIWVILTHSYLIGFYSPQVFPSGSGLVSSRLNLPVA